MLGLLELGRRAADVLELEEAGRLLLEALGLDVLGDPLGRILVDPALERDGHARAAERRARETGRVTENASVEDDSELSEEFAYKEGIPCRAINGVLPILTLVGTVIVGLFISGEGDTVTDIIGSANSYDVLIWASLLSCIVAAVLTLGQRLLSELELWEVSLVTFPMLSTARVGGKGDELDDNLLRDLAHILDDARLMLAPEQRRRT